MCRSIKTLFNFDPPATDQEINASALQFVRKLSGFNRPSNVNEAAFSRAVEDVAAAARVLIESLITKTQPKERVYQFVADRAVPAPRATPRSSG
jgi:hypothetical protein